MKSQQGTTTSQLQHFTCIHTRQTREDQQNHRCEEHSIPNDIYLVQRDEFAEKPSKASQQYRQMKLDERFFHQVQSTPILPMNTKAIMPMTRLMIPTVSPVLAISFCWMRPVE